MVARSSQDEGIRQNVLCGMNDWRCYRWRCFLINMNIGSKSKKRVVLPSRPDPPTVDQILEDINQAPATDAVYNVLETAGQDSSDSDVDVNFQQCRQYMELNQRLQVSLARLLTQKEELQAAGTGLERDMDNVRRQSH
ncbi:UPF0449 protein C19orf25 homolog isoform X2 [Cynoglossus semilaevis]|uniref:UPF0449 protein C19orf25 homolog isoform X2 n=1 Tax=Cynoglossus semilaevis TaxID=244447 RepID=UPI000D6298E0|nr:UPF0449 protein C19orf25 homolog isoform X2 [Cynoglossus semilaevis]